MVEMRRATARAMVAGASAAVVLILAACGASDGATTDSSASPDADGPGPAGPPAVTNLSGTLFYYPENTTGDGEVMTWRPEGDANPKAAIKLSGADALSSATFSPDGKRVAWVASNFDTGTTELYVANVDGSDKRLLLKEADPYCVEPTWSGDSAKLMTRPAAESSARTIDVNTGGLSDFSTPIEGCHALWAGNGSAIAFSIGTGITMAKADGSNRRAVPKLGADGGPTQRRSHDPMSLSADGRLLALYVLTGDTPDGDVARSQQANEIVDTLTGETKKLPLEGNLQQAFFLSAGGVVVRVKSAAGVQVALLSADLKLLTRATEPPAFGSMFLLGYGG